MTDPTMTIQSILSPELTLCHVQAGSKKRLLELIAAQVSQRFPALDEQKIFTSLVGRERLGSTGIGQGIAIPHCRLEDCTQVIGVLITLDEAIPFDAIDNAPVDLLFALIVPQEATNEHLELLSQLAETFNDATLCKNLRACNDAASLFNAIQSS